MHGLCLIDCLNEAVEFNMVLTSALAESITSSVVGDAPVFKASKLSTDMFKYDVIKKDMAIFC